MKKIRIVPLIKIMRTTFIQIFLLTVITCISFPKTSDAQTTKPIIVKGYITSENGKSIEGVSVRHKESTIGTSTDEEGKFEISIPGKGILVFTHVGSVTREIAVSAQTTLNIILAEQNKSLNEVVVVGYGTQRKKDLTGTVATIGGKDLQVAPTPSLFNNLAGKLPGVIVTQGSGQPGYDQPNFSIRGASTFGSNEALVLVDGIERPYSRIDPNDIESVTVLKDAASAAVYGARAANGVVLITTKQGRSGKPQVSYTGTYGIQKPTVRAKMMSAYEYAKYFNEARMNSGLPALFTAADVEKYRLGNDPDYPNTDWWAESVRKSAPTQQHNLTLQGGTDQIKYIFSLGHLNQSGLYELSSFKRNNLRTNINFKISQNLSIIVDMAGRVENTSQSAENFLAWRYMLNANPTLPAHVPDSVEKGGLGFNGLNGSPIGRFHFSGYDRRASTFLQSTAEINYKLPWIKGLSAKARFAYDKNDFQGKVFKTPHTYYIYDKVNKKYTSAKSLNSPTLDENRQSGTVSTVQFFLNYDQKFSRHNLSGLLLYEQNEAAYSNISAYREGFLSPAIDQIFGGSNLNKNNGGSASQTARQGYVGRVNYNFAEKYLFQANFRYDGSYNFAPDKRWGFFPAVSAAWRISEEGFMKNISFLSNLKVRASYGQFGNDRISPFQYLTGYVFSGGYVTGSNVFNTGIVDAGLPNRNVTWETATNTDIGLDMSFFNGKLETEATYFYKHTKDILLQRSGSVPASFGAVLPSENIGIVDNRGVEFMVRYTKTGKLTYSVEGNVTHAKSKVIFSDEPPNTAERIRRTGRPFSQTYGLVAQGFFQDQKEIDTWAIQDGQGNKSLKPGDIKYQDINNDGKVDGFDTKHIGKSGTPEYVFGFNLSTSYKGFGITANFQGATGFNRYLLLDPFLINQNALAVNINAWRPDNTNAPFPRLTAGLTPNNNQVSSHWLVDNTYLRLRNAEIFYSLPKSLVDRVGMKSVRFFVSGNNVLTFSKRDYVDPELLEVPGGNVISYPHLKSYNFGINVNF